MRKIRLAVLAAAAVMAASALTPAGAMTAATAPGIRTALAETGMVQDAATTCRHRSATSRRVCWWRPAFRSRWWHWRRWR